MRIRIGTVAMSLTLALAAIVATTGCMSSAPPSQRLARYLPDGDGRDVWEWRRTLDGAMNTPEHAMSDKSREFSEDTEPGSTEEVPPEDGAGERPIRRGDQIAISLRGIPQPEQIMEVVDDLGEITLSLIGTRRVEGLTTAQAEKMLVDVYVSEGYYQKGKITVILVALGDEFFVRGEVKGPGRYTLSGDLTLLQAIAVAGGYTDYARTSKIRVIRGESVLVFDAGRMERRKDEDPLIKPGDIIVVPRKIF